MDRKMPVERPSLHKYALHEPFRTNRSHPGNGTGSPLPLILALALAIPAQSTELLLLGCLGALAVAYVGSRQCRDRDERGAGVAMITMSLAAAGVFIALLALLKRL